MSSVDKIIKMILNGSSDSNISFNHLCNLLNKLGFKNRVKGSHHIFYKDNIEEIINIQPKGSKAKPYKVKQVRNLILKYNLGGKIDE